MPSITRWLLLIALVWGLEPGGATAADSDSLGFDLFESEGQLTVLVDLAPLLASRTVDQLRQGIDLAVEITVSLKSRRRFWGSRKLSTATGALRISYRLATEGYLITSSFDDVESERTFGSLPGVHRFLADSILTRLGEMSELDQRLRYFTTIDIVAITLTSFNLAPDNPDDNGESSPLRYLFEQFLKLTDYGREEFSLQSRTFSLSEIESGQ